MAIWQQRVEPPCDCFVLLMTKFDCNVVIVWMEVTDLSTNTVQLLIEKLWKLWHKQVIEIFCLQTESWFLKRINALVLRHAFNLKATFLCFQFVLHFFRFYFRSAGSWQVFADKHENYKQTWQTASNHINH